MDRKKLEELRKGVPYVSYQVLNIFIKELINALLEEPKLTATEITFKEVDKEKDYIRATNIKYYLRQAEDAIRNVKYWLFDVRNL